VLRLSAISLDVEQPLNNVGIDSLMAIELKNRIEADLGVTVPMVKFLEGPSVRVLATFVVEQIHTKRPPSHPADLAKATGGLDAHAAGQLLSQIDDLSDDQVEALLAELADEKGN
jgi:acyl carrier protein